MLLWITYIGLIIIGLIAKRNKIYVLACIIFFSFLALANTDAADYRSLYLPVYLNPTYAKDVEPGWLILCQLGKTIGLSYNGFACVITTLTMALIYITAVKTTNNLSTFMALFLIYPGLMVLVQFRQFVAMSIVAFASTLLEADSVRRKTGFICLVFLASTLHRTALIFLLLLFMPELRKTSLHNKIIFVIVGMLIVGLIYLEYRDIAYLVFGESKTNAYLYDERHMTSDLGGIRNILLTIAMIILTSKCRNNISDAVHRNARNTEDKARSQIRPLYAYEEIAVNAQLIMVIFIPFMLISNDFMRFERYSYLMALPLFVSCSKSWLHRQYIASKLTWLLISLLFAYEFVVKGTFETVYVPLLTLESIPAVFI